MIYGLHEGSVSCIVVATLCVLYRYFHSHTFIMVSAIAMSM